MHGKQIVIWYCSGCATEYLNGELKCAWPGSRAQLPCQQRDKTESTVCSQRLQPVREIRKSQAKGFLGPSPAPLASQGLSKMETSGYVYCERSGLGIRQAIVECMRLFTARQNPLPQQSSSFWEGKDIPNSYLLEECKQHIQWGSSTEQAGQDQEPPAGSIFAGKRQEEKLKGAHFELLSEIQNTLVPRALFH